MTRVSEVLALLIDTHISLWVYEYILTLRRVLLSRIHWWLFTVYSFTHLCFLEKKSAVPSIFIQYKALVKIQTSHEILFLFSHNGGEFNLKNFNKNSAVFGIQRQFTNPYNSTKNRVSIRRNRTLVKSARNMLEVTNLNNSFCAEAIAIVCYLQNRSFTKALNIWTPYQLWRGPTGIGLDLLHLRLFGCLAYTHIFDAKRKNLNIKCLKRIFIGYGTSHDLKSYRLYQSQSCGIFFSGNVIFSKNISSRMTL